MLQIRKKLGDKKGFTLIELIVVIAIIAILAAVLLPKFIGFTSDAKKNAAVSDGRNISVAVQAMQAQSGTYTSIDATAINTYTGKTYFGGSGKCSLLNGSATGVIAATDTSFSFTDKPDSNTSYTVTVNMSTGVISAS